MSKQPTVRVLLYEDPSEPLDVLDSGVPPSGKDPCRGIIGHMSHKLYDTGRHLIGEVFTSTYQVWTAN